jgi:hypothetical protein
MPWWTYGWRGMQLWFPSSLAEPLSPSTRDSMGFGASTDPELEFDREVYPIGISLSDVAILGEAAGLLQFGHASGVRQSRSLLCARRSIDTAPNQLQVRLPSASNPVYLDQFTL